MPSNPKHSVAMPLKHFDESQSDLRNGSQSRGEHHVFEKHFRLERSDNESTISVVSARDGIEDRTSKTLHDERRDRHRILGLNNQFSVDPCVLENPVDSVPRSVFEREGDEGFANRCPGGRTQAPAQRINRSI